MTVLTLGRSVLKAEGQLYQRLCILAAKASAFHKANLHGSNLSSIASFHGYTNAARLLRSYDCP